MLEESSGILYSPLLIVGPSGVGKGTIIKNLFRTYSSLFSFSVSHTTRGPRANEVEGKNYYFISKEEFETIREADGFLETVEYCGNYYGTSIAEMDRIRSNRRIPLLEIDIAGYVQLLKRKLKMRGIFILPPSMDELRNRLLKRGTEIEKTINTRLEIAKNEIELSKEVFFDFTVINNYVEETLQEIITRLNDWYKAEMSECVS